MRVYLDTGVLVAAFTTRGLSADVVRVVLAGHELLFGASLREELGAALVRAGVPDDLATDLVRTVEGEAVWAEPGPEPGLWLRDPDDAAILAEAAGAGADVLVTGDRDLLEVADRAPVPIVDPRGFWELVRR